MLVQILMGQPVKGTEATALRRLFQAVKDFDGLILSNFYIGPRQLDFILVLPRYTALIELKSLGGPAFGGQNGNWSIRDFTGEKREYRGLNPWSQAESQSKVLSDEMSRYQETDQRLPAPLNGQFYREFETIGCIYPTLHPDSKLEISSFKVKIMGCDDLIVGVTSQKKDRSWKISDWELYAKESLHLQTVSLEEAINERVHRAHRAVNSYRKRLRDFYSHELAPLPKATADGVRGTDLITRLMEPKHRLLVGPSGSCKSFHLRHLVVSLADGGNEVPIAVDLKGYDGGGFSRLLQQSTSPFAEVRVGKLISDINACGLRTVIVIDALNECPGAFRPKLLEKLQAFVLLREARFVMADQASVELPPEIQASAISIQLPAGNEKLQIFTYYAGEAPSEELAHLSQTFTNAFDLRLAGRCHARGDRPESRWELYSRYVRDALEGAHIVASVLLRTVAGEMMETLTMSIRRDRFEKLAEIFYLKEQKPLSAIEQLLQSRLILSGDEYIFFEHELLLDFFKTQYLTRKNETADDLASDLGRPRNAHLLELALSQCETEEAVGAVITRAEDPKPLGLALRGHCGSVAQAAVRKQCLILLALGISETSAMKLTCQTFERENGTKGLVGFDITGNKPLSVYGSVLCAVVAENLEDEAIQQDFLKLLELTDTTFLDGVKCAAEEACVGVRSAYSEAIRLYGGLFAHGNGSPFVCSGILSAIRYSRMMSRQALRPLPILHRLVSNVRDYDKRYFSFFALLIDLQRDSTGLEFEDFIDLGRRAWNTGVGWLRMEGVRTLSHLHFCPSELGPNQVIRVRELLQSFESNDLIVNTEVVEGLAAYGGFEAPVSPERALTEMCDLIDATDEPTIEQAETVALLETTWIQYRRDAAYGALGKIFEDIFMGAYSEAYGELFPLQRKKLLELAAMCSRPGFHIDWILWELLPIADVDSLPVFQRFATGVDSDTPFTQDVVSAFLASVEGYARLSDAPPPIPDGGNDDRRAWATVSSILFWSMKARDGASNDESVRLGWKTLAEGLWLCLPDILQKINESQWRTKEIAINLAKMYPEQVRPILESALRHRTSLTSLFRHGGTADERVLQTVILTLEKIGNKGSIAALERLTEDCKFGKLAVGAVHAIRAR
jgi:hypothetical protein